MTSSEDSDASVVLTLNGITKRYDGTLALDDTSFSVRSGTVHALLGENGAGKTTLMRVAFGLIAPDKGTAVVKQYPRPIRSCADAIAAGLGMVHQHFANISAMTVAENVALGDRGRYDAHAARRRVMEIAGRTGLHVDPAARVADLPVGAQQRLEIVKALAKNARILILDEPTAVLAPKESEELLRWLRAFADAGNAVVLITHKLREALAIADDVTVLRRGRTVLSAGAGSLSDATLTTAMLGLDLPPNAANAASVPGDVVASADRVTIVDRRGITVVNAVTFDVRQREIVGIAAVEGAGQRDLLRALAARTLVASGIVRRPPSIGFVPEDRHRDALVLGFSVAENIALKGAGTHRGIMSWRAIRERGVCLVREFDIRGGNAHERRPVSALSGGNQQKLVLARELDGQPSLVIAENPTRGLDVRATAYVHERLRAAAAAGAGVVVYSSDLDEVLGLATRLLVMHRGTLRESSFDRADIGRAMLGIA